MSIPAGGRNDTPSSLPACYPASVRKRSRRDVISTGTLPAFSPLSLSNAMRSRPPLLSDSRSGLSFPRSRTIIRNHFRTQPVLRIRDLTSRGDKTYRRTKADRSGPNWRSNGGREARPPAPGVCLPCRVGCHPERRGRPGRHSDCPLQGDHRDPHVPARSAIPAMPGAHRRQRGQRCVIDCTQARLDAPRGIHRAATRKPRSIPSGPGRVRRGTRVAAGGGQRASTRRSPGHRLPLLPGVVRIGNGRSARLPARNGQIASVPGHRPSPGSAEQRPVSWSRSDAAWIARAPGLPLCRIRSSRSVC